MIYIYIYINNQLWYYVCSAYLKCVVHGPHQILVLYVTSGNIDGEQSFDTFRWLFFFSVIMYHRIDLVDDFIFFIILCKVTDIQLFSWILHGMKYINTLFQSHDWLVLIIFFEWWNIILFLVEIPFFWSWAVWWSIAGSVVLF